MCFSATASFITAAALLPVGLTTVTLARRRPAGGWWPLAVTPWLFAIQQGLEGLVWLTLDGVAPQLLLHPVSLIYLGFAFALWPVWMPWSALHLASGRVRRLIRPLWGLGCLLAALLWLPLLLHPSWIDPIVRQGSIDYQVQLPWAEQLGHQSVSLVYGLIICVPLLLHPRRRLRWLALALLLAFGVAQLAFLHAFSSVWCYFSAVLSSLLIWVVQDDTAPLATDV